MTEDEDGVSPFLPLPRSWEDYLAGLSSKYRHEIKRKARKLVEEAGEFRIVTADDETMIPMLDRFVELHRMSEGPKGVFMVPGMEIFFRRLGEAFCADGVFRLSFIEVGGQLAAGTIAFVVGWHVLPLQLRVRPVVGEPRPGHGARRARTSVSRSRRAAVVSTC